MVIRTRTTKPITRKRTRSTVPPKQKVKQYNVIYPSQSQGRTSDYFWEAGSLPPYGRPKSFNNPIEVLDGALAYCRWVEDNPLMEEKAMGNSYGIPIKTEMKKKRPMTLGGLCLYLGITLMTWGVYRKQDAYSYVCEYIETIIREQKFAGAAAGFFNHAIIARDLGLVDRQDMTSGDKPIDNRTVIILPAKEIE